MSDVAPPLPPMSDVAMYDVAPPLPAMYDVAPPLPPMSDIAPSLPDNYVSPEDIMEVPLVDQAGPRRRGIKKGKTVILTSSPCMKALQGRPVEKKKTPSNEIKLFFGKQCVGKDQSNLGQCERKGHLDGRLEKTTGECQGGHMHRFKAVFLI